MPRMVFRNSIQMEISSSFSAFLSFTIANYKCDHMLFTLRSVCQLTTISTVSLITYFQFYPGIHSSIPHI